jgi:hypothetical protein
MKQQITTFESTWDLLKPGGVYICEVHSGSLPNLNPVPSRLPRSACNAALGCHHVLTCCGMPSLRCTAQSSLLQDTATSMDFAMPPSNLRGSAWGGEPG